MLENDIGEYFLFTPFPLSFANEFFASFYLLKYDIYFQVYCELG